MLRPDYEAARSAAADFPCLGSGSTTKTPVHRVHRTPLRGGWDRPCSLAVEVCRDMLDPYAPHHSD